MTSALNDQSLDQIFRSARTPNGWADRPVEDVTVREIYDLMKWGPTSANSSPARFVWVRSVDGHDRSEEWRSCYEHSRECPDCEGGKIKATNRAFRDDWVFAITVQNGKVTKIREYIDTQALARASHPARSSNAQP